MCNFTNILAVSGVYKAAELNCELILKYTSKCDFDHTLWLKRNRICKKKCAPTLNLVEN